MDSSFWLTILILSILICILYIILCRLEKKEVIEYNKTLQQDKIELNVKIQQLNDEINNLVSEREKLLNEQKSFIKPTIYIEKPPVDILEFKAKLPYYDKEDEEEVSKQLQEIIFQNFKRDMLQYVEWTEDYDCYENQQLIRARLRIIKPREI